MDVQALDAEARAILRGNDRGGYTVPTEGLYPYQWNWDSAFAAWGFATFDLDRAWVEMETLFSGQWPDGMVPHILFHKRDPAYNPSPETWGAVTNGPIPASGISQPPIAASLARWIWEGAPEASEARLHALYPKMMAWHRWFMDYRTTEAGAVCITHPWEAGRDNTPDWDGAMQALEPVDLEPYKRHDTEEVDSSMRPTKFDYDRYMYLVQIGRALKWDAASWWRETPFRVADPTMTFTLLRAHRDLLAVGEALGEDTGDLPAWIERLEAGAQSLWNDGLASFDSFDMGQGAWAGCVSNASFMNWYAGVAEDRMLSHLDRVQALVRYPVPSHDPESPRFDSMRYWRGPTWAMANALIARGLRDAGFADRADRLRQDTADLIAEHGFAEYFDPLNGSPAGGQSFTWTAAVWLAWASPTAREI